MYSLNSPNAGWLQSVLRRGRAKRELERLAIDAFLFGTTVMQKADEEIERLFQFLKGNDGNSTIQ